MTALKQAHSTHRALALAAAWTVVALLAGVAPLRAQATHPPGDNDAATRPTEPDYVVVNIPTTLPLPVHGGNFHLTHRFGGNLRSGSFGDQASRLFGLDDGATIGLEYRYGVMRHLEAIAMRTNFDREIQFSAKYDAFHQSASRPVGFSAIVSVEGANNFRTQYEPALGAVVSRVIGDKASVYVAPVWVHNSASVSGVDRETVFLGLAANLRVTRSVYVVAEVTPRIGGYAPGDPEVAFGLQKRVGKHVFQVTFANTSGTTYGQLARGGFPESLYLGFNLTRKFF